MNPTSAEPEGVRPKTKLLTCLAIFAVIVLQIGVFYVSWGACVMVARAMGRFPPIWFGELAFFIGFFCFTVICICLSIFTAIARQPAARWTGIFTGLAIWAFPILSNDFSRPIAMPVFFVVGCIVLLAGNGLLIPYLRKALERSKDARWRTEESGKSPAPQDF